MIVLCYFINYHNRTANNFSIDNCFIGDCSICSQRSFNVGFRQNNICCFAIIRFISFLKRFLHITFVFQ